MNRYNFKELYNKKISEMFYNKNIIFGNKYCIAKHKPMHGSEIYKSDKISLLTISHRKKRPLIKDLSI